MFQFGTRGILGILFDWHFTLKSIEEMDLMKAEIINRKSAIDSIKGQSYANMNVMTNGSSIKKAAEYYFSERIL